jgi:hypothetical protein
MAQPAYLQDQQILGQTPEVADLSRQRRIAELLMTQGMEQPQGQMISGHYVAPSWSQQIAPLAKAAIGTGLSQSLDEKQVKLAEALRGKQAQQIEQYGELEKTDKTAALRFALSTDNPILRDIAKEELKGIKLAEGEIYTRQSLGGGTTEMKGGEKKTTDQRDYELAKSQGFPGSFIEFQIASKKPVTNVSVNTGQHGFDNALKLRSDFRAEPIYKGFEETKAAKLQIDQAAKMATPAGDLAAATKIMKILDPGSVVRESELGMAMAATGVQDRVRNYAQMVLDGTKLTPSQRKDFTELSNKLYNASAEQFNQKRDEYAGIAQRNNLDVDAAVGAPAKIKTANKVKFLGFE